MFCHQSHTNKKFCLSIVHEISMSSNILKNILVWKSNPMALALAPRFRASNSVMQNPCATKRPKGLGQLVFKKMPTAWYHIDSYSILVISYLNALYDMYIYIYVFISYIPTPTICWKMYVEICFCNIWVEQFYVKTTILPCSFSISW